MLSAATERGTPIYLIDLVEKELQAYRETGRAIHLAHAARALSEMRDLISAQAKTSAKVGGPL